MIRVFYDEYTNDFWKPQQEKALCTLAEFKDWFFGLCKGKYEDKISIPMPDRTDIWKDGPSAIECNCMWEESKTYRVHMIMRDGAIIFSDGRHTNGQKHWNEETKQMCRDMIQRRKAPTFNFA